MAAGVEIRDIRFGGSAASWEQLPDVALPEVAFIGRSNVGKSSLINLLARRKNLARTSNVPGKTRTINWYHVNGELLFHDLPGFGYAKVSRSLRNQWLRLVSSYLAHRQELRAVVHLIDSRHAPMPLDREVMLVMRPRPVAYLVALTKADKLSGNGRAKSLKRTRQVLIECGVQVPVTLCSAKTRRGREELLGHLAAVINKAALRRTATGVGATAQGRP